ncbi:AZL_007920_fam/MXAN_0976 family protein [Kordia sp. SMS9]|uniref:MbnP family protein n=1 Tax=Kordia sp. SMS9 TaxID=2282170 RepID=UPI000E0D4E38|nr:MbnP family protein [Kordia sp. SMS9]AXG69310.1 AZL_007920_fam/MXAN_0976 family protein [Kordia sp. SMS9]
MKKLAYVLSISLLMLASSCNDDSNAIETSAVEITFDNRIAANQDLTLGTTVYVNQNNESVVTNELKYIISNLALTQDNGAVFEYPKDDSYFVINEENASSLTLSLTGIPVGNYTQISFGIGVDQSKYPLDGGVLNFIPTAEEAGMLWTWAAGYKFIKFEGTYTPQGGTEAPFVIHVGSHGQNLDNYKFVTLPLANTLNITTGNTASVTVAAYIQNIIDATNQIKFEETSDIQVDPVNAPRIATNLETTFSAH